MNALRFLPLVLGFLSTSVCCNAAEVRIFSYYCELDDKYVAVAMLGKGPRTPEHLNTPVVIYDRTVTEEPFVVTFTNLDRVRSADQIFLLRLGDQELYLFDSLVFYYNQKQRRLEQLDSKIKFSSTAEGNKLVLAKWPKWKLFIEEGIRTE